MKRHKIIRIIALTGFLFAGFSFTAFSQDMANFTAGLEGKYPGLTVLRQDATPGNGSAGLIGPLLRTEDVSGAARRGTPPAAPPQAQKRPLCKNIA